MLVIAAVTVTVAAMMPMMAVTVMAAMVMMIVIVMPMMTVVYQRAEGDRRRQRDNVVMTVMRARGQAHTGQPEQACRRDDANLFDPCFEHCLLRFNLKSGTNLTRRD